MKMTEQTKEKLLELEEDLESELENESSQDFVNDYSLSNLDYFSDAFTEYADNNTSIYYSDQRQFFNDNQSECEEALKEYAYDLNDLLKECHNDLDCFICKIGAIGEYNFIYKQLVEEQSQIIKVLVVKQLIDNDNEIDVEKLNELLDNDFDYYDKVSELEDDMNELIKEDGE